MEKVFHKESTRGISDHGWLSSRYSFSFAHYYHPERMGFGTLRVINDDNIAPQKGFGAHPHHNMEIITIPLYGSLKHKDTIGNESVVSAGEVQAMSAGFGVTHSEYNDSSVDAVKLLQIWVLPKKLNIEPSYSQKKFVESERINKAQLIVSPDGRDGSVEINQDAYFSRIKLEDTKSYSYTKFKQENGIYFLLLEGDVSIDGNRLERRDGLGLEGIDDLRIVSSGTSEVLIMEVPMYA